MIHLTQLCTACSAYLATVAKSPTSHCALDPHHVWRMGSIPAADEPRLHSYDREPLNISWIQTTQPAQSGERHTGMRCSDVSRRCIGWPRIWCHRIWMNTCGTSGTEQPVTWLSSCWCVTAESYPVEECDASVLQWAPYAVVVGSIHTNQPALFRATNILKDSTIYSFTCYFLFFYCKITNSFQGCW